MCSKVCNITESKQYYSFKVIAIPRANRIHDKSQPTTIRGISTHCKVIEWDNT